MRRAAAATVFDAACWVTPSRSASVLIVTGPLTKCWNTTPSAKRVSAKVQHLDYSPYPSGSYWEP